MTSAIDPAVPGAVLTDTDADPHDLQEAREQAARLWERHVPARYRDAVCDVPEVADWVRVLLDRVRTERRTRPRVVTGPSLLLLGATGTGKTRAVYGAIRALSVSGAGCAWRVITAADLYAQLRPRHGVDSEEVFEQVARVGLLALDDIGAAKTSEWVEEINYRLVNHRYENDLPTLITSNVAPRDLSSALGERTASRLVEMATRVVLRGPDRRLGSPKAGAA